MYYGKGQGGCVAGKFVDCALRLNNNNSPICDILSVRDLKYVVSRWMELGVKLRRKRHLLGRFLL